MKLLVNYSEDRIAKSLYDDHDFHVPDFTVGEHLPLEIALISRIARPWDSRIFTPIDPTDWTVTAALGAKREGVGGTFHVNYDTETGTILVPVNGTQASEIEAALNALALIVTAGGVVVSGENGFFTISFNNVGAREVFEADATQSIPFMLLEFVRLVTGDGSTREVQTLSISQDVAALVECTDDSAAPVATVTVLVVGSITENAQVRITLPPDRWGGTWVATVAGNQSDLIDWDASGEEVQRALELITGVGAGNVAVAQDGDDSFVILFRGALVHTAITVTATATTLKVIQTKNGVLDLSVSQMHFLLNGQESALVGFEIEVTPPAGDPMKIQVDAIVRLAVIGAGWTVSSPIPRTYFLTGLVNFTGGGPTKVDGAAHTIGKALGSIFRGVVLGTLYEWELQAGTQASNPPGIIRPTDYNAGTNAVNLILVA